MAFNSETAREAGKKSKRPKDRSYQILKAKIDEIIDSKIDDFELWLDEVAKDDPSKACDLYIKLISFRLPKPRQIELKEIVEKREIKLPPYMMPKN